MKNIGLILFISGMILALAETLYFGGNFTSKSKAESFWDCISAIMVLGGLTLYLQSKKTI